MIRRWIFGWLERRLTDAVRVAEQFAKEADHVRRIWGGPG